MKDQAMSFAIEKNYQSDNKMLDWCEIKRIIKDHYLFLLGTISLVTTSVIIITLYSTPIYESTSRIIIDHNSFIWTKNDHQENIDSNVNTVLYQTKYRLLQSREIYKQFIHNKEMTNDPLFQRWINKDREINHLKNGQDKISNQQEEERSDSLLIEKMREKIKINLVPNTQLIEITAQSQSPVLAQKMANIFAIESCNYDNNWRQSMYKESLDKIQKKIQSSLIEISKLSETKRKFNEYNPKKEIFFGHDAYEKIVASNIDSLQMLQSERNKMQLAHNRMGRKEDFTARDDDYLISVEKKIANSKAELASLSQVYKNNHPEIISLMRMIDQLSNISRNIRQENNEEIEKTIGSKADQEKEYNKKIDQMINNYNETSSLRDSFRIIQENLDAKFKTYQQLIDLSESVRINQETSFPQMRFLSKAEYPISTLSTRLLKNAILTAILTTFFSLILVVARKI